MIMGESKKCRDRSDDESDDQYSDQSSGESESELDDDDYEKLKAINLANQHNLEQQFEIAKEILRKERTAQIETQLREVRAETAAEYVNPLHELQCDLDNALEVAEHLKNFELQSGDIYFEAENLASSQNSANEKHILFMNIQSDLREKIRILEEDRHNIDINSDILNESKLLFRKRKSNDGYMGFEGRKRKALTVTGPVVIYNLFDKDIIDDWTTIKKSMKMLDKSYSCTISPDIHCKGGKLICEGTHFCRGDTIFIDSKQDLPVKATITTINQDEVWVKRTNQGRKSKLFINQLQLGKYKIRRCSTS